MIQSSFYLFLNTFTLVFYKADTVTNFSLSYQLVGEDAWMKKEQIESETEQIEIKLFLYNMDLELPNNKILQLTSLSFDG